VLPLELQNSIKNGTLSHAYLFLSRSMANEFIDALSPDSVDLNIVRPSDGKIHILTDDIEKLQEEIRFKPFGSRRVVFIDGADSMMAGPQNKLLKTLEEPLGNTIIVLYAERRDALLQTVLSRCVEIAAPDTVSECDESSIALAKQFYELKNAGAEFYQLKSLLSDIIDDKDGGRQKALDFLDALENILRDELVKSLDCERLGNAIRLTEETRKNIKSSFSLGYAMKALALNL